MCASLKMYSRVLHCHVVDFAAITRVPMGPSASSPRMADDLLGDSMPRSGHRCSRLGRTVSEFEFALLAERWELHVTMHIGLHDQCVHTALGLDEPSSAWPHAHVAFVRFDAGESYPVPFEHHHGANHWIVLMPNHVEPSDSIPDFAWNAQRFYWQRGFMAVSTVAEGNSSSVDKS